MNISPHLVVPVGVRVKSEPVGHDYSLLTQRPSQNTEEIGGKLFSDRSQQSVLVLTTGEGPNLGNRGKRLLTVMQVGGCRYEEQKEEGQGAQ